MVLFRALGWLLLALAVGAVVYDCLTWWSEGAFRLLARGYWPVIFGSRDSGDESDFS